MFSKSEIINNLRRKNEELEKKLEAIKTELKEIRDDKVWADWQERGLAKELLGLLGVDV
jgi:hypothetical protein